MESQFDRTILLIGEDALSRLSKARVAVFGIGGVGGYVCEALVRSGVGAFDLIDHDQVSLSNLNRQIIATRSSLGSYKVDVMKERMLDINPDVDVRVYRSFFLPENADAFPFHEWDYVVDAVDTVTAKLELIARAKAVGVPIICAMGAGNKLDPTAFHVADIYETSVCPLARVMRRELKKRGIEKLKVVYSKEPVAGKALAAGGDRTAAGKALAAEEDHKTVVGKALEAGEDKLVAGKALAAEGDKAVAVKAPAAREGFQKPVPGSIAFVPSVCGLIIAGEVIKDLMKESD